MKTIATLGNWTCKSFNKIKLALEKKISLNIIKRVCGLNPWLTLHVRWPHNLPTFHNNYFSNPIRRHYISQLFYRDTLLLKLARTLEMRFTTSFIKSVFNLFAMQIQWTARFICDRRSSPFNHYIFSPEGEHHNSKCNHGKGSSCAHIVVFPSYNLAWWD